MAPPRGRARLGDPASSRATRGGGISKRKPRTDRDGDVSMGSATVTNPPTGPSAPSVRGRTGRGGRGARASSRLAQTVRNYVTDQDGTSRSSKSHFNKTTLKVHGLKDSKAASNPDGGLRSLLDFLERKASKEKPITLGRGVIHGDHVWIKVNQADAPHVLRLNGYTYAGAPLVIEETTEPWPGQDKTSANASDGKPSDTKQKLLAVLASRYNPEQRLLDLSALGADPTLNEMGSFSSRSLAEKSFKALLVIASSQYKDAAQKEEAIQAVSLANNDIQDVGEIFTLAHTLPRLHRLDLSGNKLENFSKISKWRHEFRRLEELHLTGNPIVTLTNYPADVVEWFPSLQILDGHRVRTPQEAADALRAWYPTPLPKLPSNIRDGENNVASTFIRGFFSLYDHDRLSLVTQFYDSDSCFSINSAAESLSDPASKSYIKYLRNIDTLGVRSASTQQRLFTGGSIRDFWSMLPATRHPSLDQSDEWLIDCHTFPNLADPSGQGPAMGMIINVRSRFEEVDSTTQAAGIRTFSRTFILGPSMPGAPHPYRVVTDELTLGDWTSQEATTVGPPAAIPAPAAVSAAPVVPVPVPVAPVAVAAPPAIDDATRAQMIQELSRQTGMNAQYSELCLAGLANWNFDLALQSFHEKKGELPAEAFVAPA
ncbi:hypothetical protein VTI74DRAFT_3976 [Chaetomium olivicolor]